MGKFGIYENKLKEFCNENNYDFEKISELEVSWGIDTMTLKNTDGEKVVMLEGYDEKDIAVIPTEITSKELRKAM